MSAVPASHARKSPQLPTGSVRRLLIVKLGAIGDVVMAIPGAAAMHDAGYAVDWIAGTAVAPILALYPWIHVLPVEEPALLRGTSVQRVRGMLSLWRTLRRRIAAAGPYDLCAALYYDRRYRLLTLPVRPRRYLQLSERDRACRLLPGRHHTDEYARILSAGADGENPTQLAPVPPPSLPPGPLPDSGRPRVVLVPAGARNLLRDDALRRWPIANYVTLAAHLLAEGCEVVLAGGSEDGWASPYFMELAATVAPGQCIDLIGSLSVVQTLSLLDSAAVTITHDTGPLHLAGLTSTAIVTIFGPTDPRGRLPQRANSVALWGGEGFACRPCYDGREYAPCAHNGCMHQVTPAMVLAEAEDLLEARRLGTARPPRVVTPPAVTPPAATSPDVVPADTTQRLTQIGTTLAGDRL